MKSKSNKHKLEKRKKNRDEWGREELTSERKKSHGEGVVARDAAERERERACDGVLRGRESSSVVCDEIEGEHVVCAEREKGI